MIRKPVSGLIPAGGELTGLAKWPGLKGRLRPPFFAA